MAEMLDLRGLVIVLALPLLSFVTVGKSLPLSLLLSPLPPIVWLVYLNSLGSALVSCTRYLTHPTPLSAQVLGMQDALGHLMLLQM